VNNDAQIKSFGLAAQALGLHRAIELLQAELRNLNAQLAEAQPAEEPRPVGRPAGKARKSGWPADPEERSREMKRRQAVTAKKRKKAPQIHDTIAKLRKKARASWARLTPRERKARVAKMLAGRLAKTNKELPAVTLVA